MDIAVSLTIGVITLAISMAALIISIINNKKIDSRTVYFELDKQYNDLLKTALNNPELRDFSKTSEYYRLEKTDPYYIRYNLYAYMIWNFLETIFDQNKKNDPEAGNKYNTWLPVVKEENKIHYCWFKHNTNLFKQDFSDYVNGLNNLQIKKAGIAEIDHIYESYVEMFPECERKSKAQLQRLMQGGEYLLFIAYHSLLPKDDNIIGFSFVFADHEHKSLWFDYCAIKKGFQSSGYGTTLINSIIDEIGYDNYFSFFEVEIPETANINDPQNKRLRFYEKLNCLKMPYDYYLPAPAGKEKLFLYCRPSENAGIVFKNTTAGVMAKALRYIHSDILHTESVIDENLKNINEDFAYNFTERANRSIKTV